MQEFITKLIAPVIIIIAIVDGFLIARHYIDLGDQQQVDTTVDSQIEDQTTTTTEEAPVIEDVFEEPKEPEDTSKVTLDVPFTTQAMQGWGSPWDKYGEEACAYMAMQWIRGEDAGTAAERTDTLLAMGQWEVSQFGSSGDTSASQTAQIFTDYYKYSDIYLTSDLNAEDMMDLLHTGNVILLTINGQLIGSPYYTDPAPTHHTILLVGYDEDAGTFIVNDPGTSRGKQVEYSREKTMEAISDLVIVIRP